MRKIIIVIHYMAGVFSCLWALAILLSDPAHLAFSKAFGVTALIGGIFVICIGGLFSYFDRAIEELCVDVKSCKDKISQLENKISKIETTNKEF